MDILFGVHWLCVNENNCKEAIEVIESLKDRYTGTEVYMTMVSLHHILVSSRQQVKDVFESGIQKIRSVKGDCLLSIIGLCRPHGATRRLGSEAEHGRDVVGYTTSKIPIIRRIDKHSRSGETHKVIREVLSGSGSNFSGVMVNRFNPYVVWLFKKTSSAKVFLDNKSGVLKWVMSNYSSTVTDEIARGFAGDTTALDTIYMAYSGGIGINLINSKIFRFRISN
ncbi:MAG: hypothetical protein DRN81_04070 [Thermoproteota archaeon]|nr:MAG: hypothetical protein DRN81_04070 [Candidatus Korarchaeota archaeon]